MPQFEQMNSRERSFFLLLHQGFDSVQIGQLFYWNSIHIAPIGINKAEILSTNSANERPHEETLNDLIQPSKLAVILQFYSQKKQNYKAEILSTNRANERPHGGTLKDFIQAFLFEIHFGRFIFGWMLFWIAHICI